MTIGIHSGLPSQNSSADVRKRHCQHRRVEAHGAEKLPGDDLEVGQWRRQQQLDRARALLLGVGAHGDHRQDEQEDDRRVQEHGPDQLLVHVDRLAPPPRPAICMLWRSK